MEPSDQHPLPAVTRVSLKLARSRRRVRKKEVAEGEHERAQREHGRAQREHEGAGREHVDETGLSGGAKRRGLSQRPVTCWPGFGDATYKYKSAINLYQMLIEKKLNTFYTGSITLISSD